MFVLLGELNFWTFDSDVEIKNTDFGAFSYHDKKIDNVYEEGKKSYAQKRGMVYVPQNKKGNKLKDCIKYLEEQLEDYSIIYCQWFDYCTMQIMLSSGILIYIQVDLSSGDIQKIVFDKYLVGKLSDRLSDVIITKNYVVCTHNDNQVTMINFLKPKKSIFDKISRLEPKMSIYEINGPIGRRLEKKIQYNRTEDLILIWWKSTMNEVFPWSPTVKEHNRSNVHLYRVTGVKLELLCYVRTEFDPLCLIFHTNYDNVFHSLEQKFSRKGEVTVEWRTYEVSQQDRLQRIAVTSVPLPTHTSCVRFSPNQEILLLCCIDGSITLHDQLKGINSSTKAAFIPTLACWHNDGNIFAVANERGQVQHYDIALNSIKSQMLSEDIAPANILDLSSYFRSQPALIRLEWAKKNEPNTFVDYYNHGDSLFLLLFERGPIAIIRIVEGDNFSGNVLVQKYLELSQVQQATSLLLALNWDLNPHACMHSLNQIVNYLFKLPLTPERENLIQNALGSFHVPVKPLCQSVIDEYGNEVRDLTRRFFHYLLRYRLFEKAFRLAIDLNDHDLFMDIHFYAIVLKDTEMAKAAKEKAEKIISRSNSSSSSHSTCSRDSCSICSDSSERDESYSDDTESEELPRRSKIPIKRPIKHKYSKASHVQPPPLPIVYNTVCSDSGLISTSFNEVTDKTDSNLMSTPFNMPNSKTTPATYSYSIPNFIPSTYLTAEPYNSPANFNFTATSSYVQTVRSYDNLLSPFQSLSISNDLTPKVAQSSLSSMSLENISNNQETNNFYETQIVETVTSSTTSIATNTTKNLLTPFNGSLSNSASSTKNNGYNNKESEKDTIFNGTLTFKNDKCSSVQNASNNELVNDTDATTKVNLPINREPSPLSIFNTSTNLMSTSFNDAGDLNDNSNSTSCNSSTDSNSMTKKHSILNIPPLPPSIVNDSLPTTMQKMPMKNYSLNCSGSDLSSRDNSFSKIHHSKPKHTPLNLISQQSSVSNILQSRHKNNNTKSTSKYRLDYDLDYETFNSSCDNVSKSNTPTNNFISNSYNYTPKPYDSKSYKLGFSHSSSMSVNCNKDFKQSSNMPPLPVITTSSNDKCSSLPVTATEVVSNISDKPKVKFSDTVTHILVPNSNSTYRPSIQKRLISQLHPMDPKKELADSLPLCLGNEDYLKDFQPLSKDDCDKAKEPSKPEEPAKIKVVHFGLL